jgi:hypothetical protein
MSYLYGTLPNQNSARTLFSVFILFSHLCLFLKRREVSYTNVPKSETDVILCCVLQTDGEARAHT